MAEPAIAPSCDPRGRWRRSHHSRTSACRTSASGSAPATGDAADPGRSAFPLPRGTPHLGPVPSAQKGQGRGDLFLRPGPIIQPAVGTEHGSADRAVPSPLQRPRTGRRPLRPRPGHGRGGGYAAHSPVCRRPASTRRSAASASSQSARPGSTPGSRPAGPPGWCGTRPGRSPVGSADPRVAVAGQRDAGL